MAVEELPELDLSNFTTSSTNNSSTNPKDDHSYSSGDRLPVVNMDGFSVQHDDDLFISEMGEDIYTDKKVSYSDDDQNLGPPSALMIEEVVDDQSDEDTRGLRLVHLLMAAAEAMNSGNKSHDLAAVILVRLKELVSTNEGTNMERLAAYFTHALCNLLETDGGGRVLDYKHHHHRTDVMAAFQLLQDMSPYVKFGHFTANQAIIEAVSHERRVVHIIDYDIMEGIQWASLMQALVSRKDGSPTPHLRITALSQPGNGRRSNSAVKETGRHLIAFADAIGQPFSFHQCKLDAKGNFKPTTLKLAKGETIVINCMLHLPHLSYHSPASVASFLSGSRTLNPKLVTLVEEEAPRVEGGFMGRFMDTLHNYSAVCDSLEAGFPTKGRSRALVESVFLGPRILGSLARMYREKGQFGSWGNWLSGAGFHPISISSANHCQAKLLLGLFNDGYRVEKSTPNNLVLGWKSRKLLTASIWGFA